MYEASKTEMQKFKKLKKDAQSSHEMTYELVQKGQPFAFGLSNHSPRSTREGYLNSVLEDKKRQFDSITSRDSEKLGKTQNPF